MRTRRWLVFALAAAAVLLLVGRSVAGVYSDYLWYDSLGASALWRARMGAVATLRLGSGVLAALFAFANLYAVRKSVVSLVFPRRLANLEIGEEVPGRYLIGAALSLAAVLGVLLALPSNDWASLLLATSGRPFNEVDPYFGADFGFFVYWLPLENALWMWAFVAVIVVAIAVVLLYALTPSLKWQRGALYASGYVRRHFTVLVGVLLLMLAWSFRLDMYGLLLDGSGADGAFAWADHRVGVPGDLLMALLTLGAALIVLWAGFAGQMRLAAFSVLTVIVLSLIVREVAPAVAEHNGTDAQRTARERPYLATRATYTRRGFAVDRMPRADSSFAFPSLAAALPWIPVWDPPALARAANLGRAGDERPPAIGWRFTGSGLAADVIEPAPQGAASRAPWTVIHVASSDADERGAPLRLAAAGGGISDDRPIEAPLVYPGAPKMAVVPDSLSHAAGTLLESWLARLATAWSMQDFRLLSGDMAQPHPTLISHRDVRDRVEMYAPFFAQGHRVDPILLGDSLYWAVDLYSSSDTYPLSRRFFVMGEERAYLHHAAVAVVQGSTGEIVIVADSVLDPVAASWKARLPSLFGTWNTLPAGLRAQLAPPIDGLLAQANAFGRYGTRGENEAPRHVPVLDGADSALATDHLPIVLPGGRAIALALPLVDETDRLRGLLIGTGGATQFTAWYALATPGLRWSAMLDRLRSVDSAGSAVRDGPLAHGRVRAVPVRSGIAFAQPSYRWRGPGSPALSRVAVVSGDTARSLAPPITNLPSTIAIPAGADFKASVAAVYAAMREALRRGDLTAFGRAFDALGHLLGGHATP